MEYFFTAGQILVEGKRIRRGQSKKVTHKFYMCLSSNGKYFVEHDFLTGCEKNFSLDHFDIFKKVKPRYYRRIAIDKTVQAVAKGLKRILLVMATGTGKTFTAFQIVWRLLKSKKIRRVLYLADQNVLIDQTIGNDFKPLEKVLCKVEYKKLDCAFQIFRVCTTNRQVMETTNLSDSSNPNFLI